MRITTCVPKQKKTLQEKFDFIVDVLKKEKSDILVLPQEYFGGWLCERISFRRDQVLPLLLALSVKYNCGIIVGVVEEETDTPSQKIYQKLWFIDKELKGEIVKFATPSYDLIGLGTHNISSIENVETRFKTFEIKGINVAGVFCWEIFSSFLMAGISLLEPDLVVSAIKFGIAGYPKLEMKGKLKQIVGVQYCGGDIWYDRLKFSSIYEVKCPIACSTNSWNVSSKYRPLVGIMYPYDELFPSDAEAKEEDVVNTTEIDFGHVRGLRENKFSYLERVDKFPDYKYSYLTMLMKIHRIEQRLLGPTLMEGYYKTLKSIRRKNKRINKL